MFDIGFWELALIGVVALLVIGPERLPKVARTVGLWVGRMRGFVMTVKSDIDKELRAEELKRVMEQQAKSAGLHEIYEETKESLDELNQPDYLVKAEKPAEKAAPEKEAEQAEMPEQARSSDNTNTKQDDERPESK
jgi:sec-independent protein translocase protein TatB